MCPSNFNEPKTPFVGVNTDPIINSVNNNNIDYSTETSFKTSNSALWIKVNLPNDYSPHWVEYEFVNNTSNIETVLKENTRKRQSYRRFRFTHNKD